MKASNIVTVNDSSRRVCMGCNCNRHIDSPLRTQLRTFLSAKTFVNYSQVLNNYRKTLYRMASPVFYH